MEAWFQILKEYGPWVALVAFFIWRDYEREKSQNKKNSDLEEFIRTTLVALVRDTMAVIQDNSSSMKRINSLPCALSSGMALDDRIREQLATLGVIITHPTGASAAPSGLTAGP